MQVLVCLVSEVDYMDSLRSCVAPLQEYLLQGSILDSHRDLLLHRLNGLCDNIDTGPEKFHDQELVYTMRKYVDVNVSFLSNFVFVNGKTAPFYFCNNYTPQKIAKIFAIFAVIVAEMCENLQNFSDGMFLLSDMCHTVIFVGCTVILYGA